MRHSQHLSKVVYGGNHRRWLPPQHPYRYDTNVFRMQELEEAPTRMDANKHIRWVFLRAEYAQFGGRLAADGDPMLCSGVKRLPVVVYYAVLEGKHELICGQCAILCFICIFCMVGRSCSQGRGQKSGSEEGNWQFRDAVHAVAARQSRRKQTERVSLGGEHGRIQRRSAPSTVQFYTAP